MTTDQKLEVALDALKRIKALPETTYGDHWSHDNALHTDTVHDIVDQALCFCLPIEEVRQELIEQGIDTANLKSWASERLKEVQSRNPAPQSREHSPVSALVQLAEKIAREAHAGQFRRDGVTPYITHPEAVAKALEAQGEVENVVAAAWLHDVLEDTDWTSQKLRENGIHGYTLTMIELLTKMEFEKYENYLESIKQSRGATRIKIADILHNLSDSPTGRQRAKYAKALGFLAYSKTKHLKP